jgi:REP element-mobilizing transposase RayT
MKMRQSETAATVVGVRERLKRLDVMYQHFPIYFVTACTAKRKQLLATETVHRDFKEFASSGPNYGAWVGAFVFMPDHFHLFVAVDDQKLGLSRWGKALKGKLSSALRVPGTSAPYWQKGFFDHVLRSAESYSQKWEYVRENPVRVGLVKRWEDWPYLGEIFDLRFHDWRL